jgi:hypothetical protein
VAPDLAHRHGTRIEAQNLVIEAAKPGLSLGDQLRLETASTTARYRDLDIVRQDRLRHPNDWTKWRDAAVFQPWARSSHLPLLFECADECEPVNPGGRHNVIGQDIDTFKPWRKALVSFRADQHRMRKSVVYDSAVVEPALRNWKVSLTTICCVNGSSVVSL